MPRLSVVSRSPKTLHYKQNTWHFQCLFSLTVHNSQRGKVKLKRSYVEARKEVRRTDMSSSQQSSRNPKQEKKERDLVLSHTQSLAENTLSKFKVTLIFFFCLIWSNDGFCPFWILNTWHFVGPAIAWCIWLSVVNTRWYAGLVDTADTHHASF